MADHQGNKPGDESYLKVVAVGIMELLLIFAPLFLVAGRLDYWQGWVLAGCFVLMAVAAFVVFSGKRDLLRERLHPGPGVKRWDKVLVTLCSASFFAVFLVAPLDVARFGWSPTFPPIVYVIGYAVLVLSSAFIFWAVAVNPFFSSMVRIQSDRGQRVIQNGPYQFVRHPGYAGLLPMVPAMAIVLGSLWALIPAGISIGLFVIRTYLEDRMLQQELSGYTDYAQRVRYRLLPWVW